MKISTTWKRILPYTLAAVMMLSPLAQQSAVWATAAETAEEVSAVHESVSGTGSADSAGVQPAAAETVPETAAEEAAAESETAPSAEISAPADTPEPADDSETAEEPDAEAADPSGSETSGGTSAERADEAESVPETEQIAAPATEPEQPAGTTAAENTARSRARRNAQDEIIIGDYVYSKSKAAILLYKGNAADVAVPANLSLDGVTYPVEAIGDRAFASTQTGVRLNSVTLPDGLQTIGENAFAVNDLKALVLPASLTGIGKEAFAHNQIKTLTAAAPAALYEIGEGAFRDNKLEALDFAAAAALQVIAPQAFAENVIRTLALPAGLTKIGDRAFEGNALAEVALPAALAEYGSGVFRNNGRYVYLTGGSAAVHTDIEAGAFGALYKPVALWVKGVDQTSGDTVLSARKMENDPYVEKEQRLLLYEGNTVHLAPPTLPRYIAEPIDLTLTADAVAGYTETSPYIIEYKTSTKDPVISGLKPLHINLGEAYDLRDGVTARDEFGNDITQDIVVTPDTINNEVEAELHVVYSVTDQGGNTTRETRLVLVGIDPMELETGKGWQMKDFTYSGDTVTGLSESGRQKLESNRDIVLPAFNPTSENRDPITAVGSGAFRDKGLVNVTFPESVIEIQSGAFSGNDLTALSLPDHLTTIGSDAFAGNQLLDVTFPDSVTAIQNGAFRDNHILNINLPAALTEIGDAAFQNNKLTGLSLPAAVRKVGNRAFMGNELTGVNLNDGLAEIGGEAFKDNKIESLNLPPTLTRIGNEAFRSNQLTRVELGDRLTDLGSYVFADNRIASFDLPSGMTALPEGTFYNNKLKQFSLPAHITSIGNYAFSKNQFESVDIPATVTGIGDSAFEENFNLKTVSFHDGLQTIGHYAFYKTALDMPELKTPSTLKRIGDRAFDGTGNSDIAMKIRRVVLNEGLTAIGSSAFRKVYAEDVALPSTLNRISDYAFDSNALTELTVPVGATVIGSSAFSNNTIGTLSLPEGLTDISPNAFYNNKNLTAVTLPSTLKTIGSSAFAYNRLAEIDVPASVVYIGDNAFQNNQLARIDLKDTLQTLGSYAFDNNRLTSVRLPALITKVPYAVFRNNLIRSVEFAPGTTEIKSEAFRNNHLTAIQLPDTLTAIGGLAFAENRLQNQQIPDSVQSIGSGAFKNNRLETVQLPAGLTELASEVFCNNQLTSADIPAAVTRIGDSAFRNNLLTAVHAAPGSALNRIGGSAFQDNRLETVNLPSSLVSMSPSAFTNNTGWPETPDRVRVLLRDAANQIENPNHVADGPGYRVNTTLVTIRKVLQGTSQEIAAPERHLLTIGEAFTYTPKETVAYQPVSAAPIQIQPAETPQTVEVPYTARPDFNPDSLTVSLTHAVNGKTDPSQPAGLKAYYPTNNMPVLLKITSSGDVVNIPDAWAVIDLNRPVAGGHISPDVIWPSNMSDFATEWKIENGQMKIKLKTPITANYAVEIPLYLKFQRYETPNNFVLDLTGQAYVAQGDHIIKRSDSAVPIGMRATTS